MVLFKNLKQILFNFDNDSTKESKTDQKIEVPTYNFEKGSYMSIEGGFSVRIRSKYCDFTGFSMKYIHKESGLRYREEKHIRWIEKM
jgi:hypothetical protein